MLICCGSLLYAHQQDLSVPIKIESDFLKTIDKIPHALEVGNILTFTLNATKMLFGRDALDEHLVSYQKNRFSIIQLVEIEKRSNNKHELKPSLHDAIKRIKLIAGPALESLRQRKKILEIIIEKWCEQRKKKESSLKIWVAKPEQQFIDAHLTSFQALYDFLHDLTSLLRDVLYTCENSVKLYKKEYAASHPHREP